MGEKIAIENGRISRLSGVRDLDLDLGSGHTAYLHASLVDVYLRTKDSLKSKKVFVDGRTNVRTDGRADI